MAKQDRLGVHVQAGLLCGVPKIDLVFSDRILGMQLSIDEARQLSKHLTEASIDAEKLALDPAKGIPNPLKVRPIVPKPSN